MIRNKFLSKIVRGCKAKNSYELLGYICKLVNEEPRRMDMSTTLRRSHAASAPACGTVGCIAGWTNLLTNANPMGITYELRNAADVISGVTSQAGDPLTNGFRRFFCDYRLCSQKSGTKHHARAVVKHIRKYMAKHRTRLKKTSVKIIKP